MYARHVWILLRPGGSAGAHTLDLNKAGDISAWSSSDIRLLIEEGRRQVDTQHEDLERVRSRAQAVLAIGLVLEGTAGSLRAAVDSAHATYLWVLWIVALLFVAWGVLGSAATAVVRADMQVIHAAVLSRRAGNVERCLAEDYAEMVAQGEDQIGTRLINLRIAVASLLIGAALTLGTWLGADAMRSTATHSNSTSQIRVSICGRERLTRPPVRVPLARQAGVSGPTGDSARQSDCVRAWTSSIA